MQARIATCIPSNDVWKARTAVSYSELRLCSAANGVATACLNYQSSTISLSRNTLVRTALALDPPCTHILFIDSDLTFPPDALIRLLQHDKDIVGAFYNRRTPPYATVGHLVKPEDVWRGGLYPADLLPVGFSLIKRHVFETIGSPWFYESYDAVMATADDPDGTVSEDVGFCRKVLASGLEMWCDADLTFEMGHIGELIVPCERPEPKILDTSVENAA